MLLEEGRRWYIYIQQIHPIPRTRKSVTHWQTKIGQESRFDFNFYRRIDVLSPKKFSKDGADGFL